MTDQDWFLMIAGVFAGFGVIAFLTLLLTAEGLIASWFQRRVADGFFVAGVVLTILVSGAILIGHFTEPGR